MTCAASVQSNGRLILTSTVALTKHGNVKVSTRISAFVRYSTAKIMDYQGRKNTYNMALKKNKPVNCPFMIGKLFNSKPKALTIFFSIHCYCFLSYTTSFLCSQSQSFWEYLPFSSLMSSGLPNQVHLCFQVPGKFNCVMSCHVSLPCCNAPIALNSYFPP